MRHTLDLWRLERGYSVMDPDTGLPATKRELCCAIVFNAMGYLKELVDPAKENITSRRIAYVHTCGCVDSNPKECNNHRTFGAVYVSSHAGKI
jgi:hypothetical protein